MEDALIHLKEECNFKNRPRFIRHLHGGDINTVYLIEAEKKQWFVKQNKAIQFPLMFEKSIVQCSFCIKIVPCIIQKCCVISQKTSNSFWSWNILRKVQTTIKHNNI